jgi:uncharacterized protein involved in exopolysaccharide biosynthesis
VFVTLTREYEQARIAEVRDTPVLTIIDRAVPPYKKSWPKRALITILATILGGMIGVGRIYLRRVTARAEAEGRPEYKQFEDALAGFKAELRRLAQWTRQRH